MSKTFVADRLHHYQRNPHRDVRGRRRWRGFLAL